jgi:acetylornithine deacetylase/succinyl-diaminopimelate desuccinylase-like protein
MTYLLSKAPFEEDWQVIAEKTAALLPPDENPSNMGAALGIREGGTEYSDLISVNMGLLSLDDNADSGSPEIYFNVNIRYAGPGADVLTNTAYQSGEEIREKVRAKFENSGLTATPSGGGVPYTVPMDSEIMTKLQKAYLDITGKPVTPCITIGGTYAAAWSTFPLSADSEETFGYRMVSWGIDGGIGMHESNESMPVEKLIEGTKIMARAMVYLASDSSDDSKDNSGCNAAGLWGIFALAASGVALRKFRRMR